MSPRCNVDALQGSSSPQGAGLTGNTGVIQSLYGIQESTLLARFINACTVLSALNYWCFDENQWTR